MSKCEVILLLYVICMYDSALHERILKSQLCFQPTFVISCNQIVCIHKLTRKIGFRLITNVVEGHLIFEVNLNNLKVKFEILEIGFVISGLYDPVNHPITIDIISHSLNLIM